MYLLVSLKIVQPRECLTALRAFVRPFSSMAELMISAMKVARKCFSAKLASVIRCRALRCISDELLR